MDQRIKGDTPASARSSRDDSGISSFSSSKPASQHRRGSRGVRGTSPRIRRGGREERGSYSRERSPLYTYSRRGEGGGSRSLSSSPPSSYYDDTTDGREVLSRSRSRSSRSRSNPQRRHVGGRGDKDSFSSVSPPSRQRSRTFSPRRKRNRSSSYSSSSSSDRRPQDLHCRSPRPTDRYSSSWKTRRSTSREKGLPPKQYSSLPSSFPKKRDERERPAHGSSPKFSLSPSRSPPRRSEERDDDEEVLRSNDANRLRTRISSNSTEDALAHHDNNDIAEGGEQNNSSVPSFSALLQDSLPVVVGKAAVAEHSTRYERTRRRDHQHGTSNNTAASKLHKTNTFENSNHNTHHHHASSHRGHRSEKGRHHAASSNNEADIDEPLMLNHALMADYVLVPPPELVEVGVVSNKDSAQHDGLRLLEEGDLRFKSGFNRPRSPPPAFCPPHPQAERVRKTIHTDISLPPYTNEEEHEQATHKYTQHAQSNEIILTNVWAFMEEESIIRAIKRAVAIHEGTHDRRYEVHKMWMPRRTLAIQPQKKDDEGDKTKEECEAKSSAEKPKQPQQTVVEIKAVTEPEKGGNNVGNGNNDDDDDLLDDIDDLLKDLEDDDDDDDDDNTATHDTTSKPAPEEEAAVVKQIPTVRSAVNLERNATVSTSATPPNSKDGQGSSSNTILQARSPAAAVPSATPTTSPSCPNLNLKEKKSAAFSQHPTPLNEKRRGPRSWNAKPLPPFEDEEFDDVVINTCRNPLYQPGGPLDVSVLYQKAKKQAIAAASEKAPSSRGSGLIAGVEGSSHHPPSHVNFSSVIENTFDYFNVRGELRVTGMCPLFRSSCHKGIIPSQSNLLRKVQRTTNNGGSVAFIPLNYPPSSTTGLVWYSNPDGPVDEVITPFAVIVQFATVLDCERVLRALRSPYRKYNRCRDVLFVPHRAHHPLPFETRRSPHFTSPFVSAVTVYPYPDPSDCVLPRTPTQDELFMMCYHRDTIARSTGTLASNRGVGWRADAIARGEIGDDYEEEPHRIGGDPNNNTATGASLRRIGGGFGARAGEELRSRKEGVATKAAEPSYDPPRVTALHRFMAEDPARVRELKEFLTTLFDDFDRLHPADKEFYNANMKVFMATPSNTPATSISAGGSEVGLTTPAPTSDTTTNSLAAHPSSLSVKERLALKRAALEAAKNHNQNNGTNNNNTAGAGAGAGPNATCGIVEAQLQTATPEHTQASAAPLPPVPTARELLMQKLAAKRAELGLATSNSSASSSSTPTPAATAAENLAATVVVAATNSATSPASLTTLPAPLLVTSDTTFVGQHKIATAAGTTGGRSEMNVDPAVGSPAAAAAHQLPLLDSLPADEAEDAALEKFFASEHRSRNVLLLLVEHTFTNHKSNAHRSSDALLTSKIAGGQKRGRDDDEGEEESDTYTKNNHHHDRSQRLTALVEESLGKHSSDRGGGGAADAEPDWYFRSDLRTSRNERGNYQHATANSIGIGNSGGGGGVASYGKPSSIPMAMAPAIQQQQQQQPSTAFLYGGSVPALFSFGFPLPPSTQVAIANSAMQQQSALAASQSNISSSSSNTNVDSAALLALSKAAWSAKSFAPHLCRHNVISRYALGLGGTNGLTGSATMAGEGAENENKTENDILGSKDGKWEAPFCPLSLGYDIQMKGVSAEAIRNAQQWLR